jgi:lysylphosphatidylglycerol synthetase-like protein (DUF2156 family)
MKERYFSPIRNPLTIVALFVGLTEIGFAISLRQMPASLQLTIGWFLVLFPCVCAICFFAVLFFRPKNFYSPADFRSDDSYIMLNRQIASFAMGYIASLWGSNLNLLFTVKKGEDKIKIEMRAETLAAIARKLDTKAPPDS